jgi:antitoxin ParD1/3/4
MNVSLTAELETVIAEKVRSGLYSSASEVVREALRRTFCQPHNLDLEEDTPELAALIREGVKNRHTPHRKGDVRRLLEQFRQRSPA